MSIAEFDQQVAAIDGVTVYQAGHTRAQAELSRRVLLVYYIRADGSITTVQSADNDIYDRNRLLNEIVNIYLTGGRLHRTNSENVEELRALYPAFCAVVVFPSFTPAEVLVLAGVGAKLPPGLTRHIIHGRALRVNYPLDRLKADESLQSKNTTLVEWMQAKLDKKHVRFYAESTILFDE
jgi:hypothetical protein